MFSIFEKEMVQGPKKQCSQVSTTTQEHQEHQEHKVKIPFLNLSYHV